MKKSKKSFHKREGFALVELMLSAAILIIFLVGLLEMLITCQGLSEVARSTTFATSEIQSWWENVRNQGFTHVSSLNGGGPPNDPDQCEPGVFGCSLSPPLNGKYVVYIDERNPPPAGLLELRIVASWREANTRVIGEDLNLNGQLDPGEDKDGDGRLSSQVTIVTLISQR